MVLFGGKRVRYAVGTRSAWRAWCRANGFATGKTRAAANGVILYEGPSMIDGREVVVILTGLAKPSDNGKADMLQSWILVKDEHPVEATVTGGDYAICGSCPHRWHSGGRCYVVVGEAPTSVWRAYQRGRYPHVAMVAPTAFPQGLTLRRGSYGDPGAVPRAVWDVADEVLVPSGSSGYTRRWRERPDLLDLCMASVLTPAERLEANLLGFRTFRVREKGDGLLDRERPCPASEEAGKVLTCSQCRQCDGSRSTVDRRPDRAIDVHGIRAA